MKRAISLFVLLVLIMGLTGCAANGAQDEVRVDFANHTGTPLLKRQNIFSPAHSFMNSYASEFVTQGKLLVDLRAESQRMDLFMGGGGIGNTLGTGTPDKLGYNYMALDMTMKQFYKNGVLPYLGYFATPSGLFDPDAPGVYWKHPPVSMEGWQEVCKNIAAHYVEKGWPIAAHEIWNEPDWGTAFYDGTWEEYLEIYKFGALGVRSGNPYAMVGGLSLATFTNYMKNGNVDQFLTYVKENDLPLDFISYHCYVPANYKPYTVEANTSLAKYGDAFNTTGLHLNEFHISMSAGTTATEKAVAPMMDAISYFVETPTITSVNWACFRATPAEQSIELINSRTGKRYAAYHVLDLYNEMPVDRVFLDAGKNLNGFASIEGGEAAVLLYNRTAGSQDFTLKLENLSYGSCDIKVYAIDKQHSNYGRIKSGSDELSVIYEAEAVNPNDWTYKGKVSQNGLVYVDIRKTGADTAEEMVTALVNDQVVNGGVARVLRRDYYFEDRNTTAFSEFDLGSFTAWVGMGNAKGGLSKGSVVMDNLPEKLVLRPSLTRAFKEGGAVYVTAEYLDEDGNVLETRSYLSGNAAALDQQADWQILPLGGELILETPADFSGALRLSYGMADAGEDVSLKVPVDKE
ncbi:MAG: hypothetical protein E7324_05940 [Clostridiales bacterium]|nr:hypothetical protein [Clostridiales bacterium]